MHVECEEREREGGNHAHNSIKSEKMEAINKAKGAEGGRKREEGEGGGWGWGKI